MAQIEIKPSKSESSRPTPLAVLRWLAAEFRDFPATMVLCTLWVLVFGVMVVDQARLSGDLTPHLVILGPVLGPVECHRFGDLTIRDVETGEEWRALTATFVHLGLLHIGVNLWALYQLGSLLESWYGTGPLVAIYVLTGGWGNLLSVGIRRALGSNPFIHSAGGSTAIMGLVALCAVVGWRARTRMGDHLRTQMVWAMLLTAGLGIGTSLAGYPVFDNWGRAGGAIVGAVVGLAHRGIIRQAGRLPARLAGVLATLLISASAFALLSDDRAEDRLRLQTAEQAQRLAIDERLIVRLERVREAYRSAVGDRVIVRGSLVRRRPLRTYPGPVSALPSASAPSPRSDLVRLDPDQEFAVSVLSASLKYLNSMTGELDRGANLTDFRQARRLLIQTLYELPTLDEVREFDGRLSAILARVRSDRAAAASQQSVARTGG